MSRAIVRCFRNMFLQTGRRSATLHRHRLLQHEQLEPRYLLTLPVSQTFAEGDTVTYNGPTVDLSTTDNDARLVLNLTEDVRYIIAVADNPATTAGNVSIIVSAPFRTGSFLLVPDAFGDATASVLLDVPTDIDDYSLTAPADATGGLTISASGSTLTNASRFLTQRELCFRGH